MEKRNGTRTNTDEHRLDLLDEVRKKKEFSGLPNSVVGRALRESKDDVKEARALLRKYFGVFLTNRVLRFVRTQDTGHRTQEILKFHISSKKRDYGEFYGEIFSRIKNVKSVVDLGCGANGFSYEFLPEGVSYVGIEAAGQLVDQMNVFFKDNDFDGRSICGDLFDLDFVVEILKKAKRDRVVFLFQVVDALENMERNFSLKLISEIMKNCEVLVLSLPLVSLGGGKKFAVKRKWLMDFLVEDYNVERDFEMFGERILIVQKK